MTPEALLDKAATALSSARLLLDAGDADGACNRAYYAMFDAARAALIQVAAVPDPAAIKTHSGLIAAFSLHLVKSGQISTELGKALNRAHEVRLIADYTGDQIRPEQISGIVDQAAVFVETIGRLL